MIYTVFFKLRIQPRRRLQTTMAARPATIKSTMVEGSGIVIMKSLSASFLPWLSKVD
jgi:hypothetical protein